MSAYMPGPGDILGLYTGHPNDPRTPDINDDDPTVDVINDVRQFLAMAEVAALNGDMGKAKNALVEARLYLDDLVGLES